MFSKMRFLMPFLFTLALAVGIAGLSTVQAAEKEKTEEQKPEPSVAIPVVVDGVEYSVAKFKEVFSRKGVVLYYLVDAQTETEGLLYAFTTQEGMVSYVKENRGEEMNLDLSTLDEAKLPEADKGNDTKSFAACGGYLDYQSQFYEHHKCKGYSLLLTRGYYYPNLGWWDNRISSLKTAKHSSWTCLTSAPSLGGSWICFGKKMKVKKLSSYGWNDIASSLIVYP